MEVNVESQISDKQKAKKKLNDEMAKVKDKSFADPIIRHLLKRCEEDQGLAEDVMQQHKTWKKCFDYIYSKARKQANGNCAAVRDDVVYEWAEDYYHKDDKADEEAKAKKAAEEKKKRSEMVTNKIKSKLKGEVETDNPKVSKPIQVVKKEEKKNSKDIEGQMDLFSMLNL